MTELRSILDEAVRQELISPEAGGRLLPFLMERGVAVVGGGVAEAQPAMEAEGQAWSDTETPSFVRGFHDVLITIGVAVALAGLWGLPRFMPCCLRSSCFRKSWCAASGLPCRPSA